MLQNYNNLKKLIFTALITLPLLLTYSCAKEKTGEETSIFKKKRINPNVDERAREAADKGPSLLDRFGNNNTNFQFGTSNVLWRATLSSLNFMPLLAVDYAGGVIVTDWYGENLNNDNKEITEEIKMTIRFLSNDISISSIEISSYKKKCEKFRCNILANNKDFNKALKEKIITLARQISVEDEKQKSNKKK
jgi:hypothetical protein